MVQTKRSKPGKGKGGLPEGGPARSDCSARRRGSGQLRSARGADHGGGRPGGHHRGDLGARYRGSRLGDLAAAAPEGQLSALLRVGGGRLVLHSLVGEDRAEILALERHKGSAEAIAAVDAAFAAAGLTLEAATAQTFANCLNEVERIERMIALAESRKNEHSASWTGTVPLSPSACAGRPRSCRMRSSPLCRQCRRRGRGTIHLKMTSGLDIIRATTTRV